jgi:hypothetical protein
MCDVRELFCKNIEGYLGCAEDPGKYEILFVFREPNDVNQQNGFWFKEVVEGKKLGTKYKNVLGRIANKLLNKNDDYSQILKECAYMNISPFCGRNSKTPKFDEILSRMEHGNTSAGARIDPDSCPQAIADNRLSIIHNVDCKYIVTVYDIFGVIKPKDSPMLKGLIYGCEEKKREFGAFELQGSKVVVNFYHPCCAISYDKLNNSVFCRENQNN